MVFQQLYARITSRYSTGEPDYETPDLHTESQSAEEQVRYVFTERSGPVALYLLDELDQLDDIRADEDDHRYPTLHRKSAYFNDGPFSTDQIGVTMQRLLTLYDDQFEQQFKVTSSSHGTRWDFELLRTYDDPPFDTLKRVLEEEYRDRLDALQDGEYP